MGPKLQGCTVDGHSSSDFKRIKACGAQRIRFHNKDEGNQPAKAGRMTCFGYPENDLRQETHLE